MASDDEQQQPQFDDEEVRAISAQVRTIFAQARSPQNSPTRLFDAIQGLLPIPQLLDELVQLRAEVAALRVRLSE